MKLKRGKSMKSNTGSLERGRTEVVGDTHVTSSIRTEKEGYHYRAYKY